MATGMADGQSKASAARAVDFLPEDVVAVAVLRDGDSRAGEFRSLLDSLDFYRSPTYRSAFQNPGTVKARLALEGFAANSGQAPWEAIGNLLGSNLAIGFGYRPGQPKPDLLLASVARDSEMVMEFLDAIHRFSGLDSLVEAVDRAPPFPSRAEDVPIFSSKNDLHHCYLEHTLLVSSHRPFLTRAIDAHLAGKGRFSDTPAYRSVIQTVPESAVAWAQLDVGAMRATLTPAGKWPEKLGNPFGAFLFGGLWRHLSGADQALLWAEVADRELTVSGRVRSRDPLPESHRGFVVKPVEASFSASRLPRYLGEIAVTRGWADLFAERESLLDRKGVGALARFTTNINTLLGRLDFVDELLPGLEGATRLVAAGQVFSAESPVPSPRLPAFALVTRMNEAADRELAGRLEKATQMAFSHLNLDAVQKKLPTFLIETERYRDHRLLVTTYDEIPERPGLQFNFAPAAALVERHWIVATSRALLEDLVDAVIEKKRVAAAEPATAGDTIDVDVRAVADALRQNRRELVADQMRKKDLSRRRAAQEIDGLIGALDFLKRFRLKAESTASCTEVTVRVSLNDAAAIPRTAKRRKL